MFNIVFHLPLFVALLCYSQRSPEDIQLVKNICTSCDIHYIYDGFAVRGKAYRSTKERPCMIVTNRILQCRSYAPVCEW